MHSTRTLHIHIFTYYCLSESIWPAEQASSCPSLSGRTYITPLVQGQGPPLSGSLSLPAQVSLPPSQEKTQPLFLFPRGNDPYR